MSTIGSSGLSPAGQPTVKQKVSVVSPTMISIPAGSITLRDARTSESRKVELQSFALARAPVTWGHYSNVFGIRIPDSEEPDAPVHSISWLGAVKWCDALSHRSGLTPAYNLDGDRVIWKLDSEGYRLPTEAEWEFACRAGSSGPHYGPLEDIAWTDVDDLENTQNVELKHPNDFGLFDTLGNVWEWCWDYLDPARYADYRVLRGGGWADKHWNVRASVRRGSMPGVQLDDVGFRVARGAIGSVDDNAGQGWSLHADAERAQLGVSLLSGWTPLRT